MAYWWANDPTERSWVEIRRAEGIGSSLWAPNVDEAGHLNAWYELVNSVRRGDTIYHYNARESRFVGRSRAAANAVEDLADSSYSVDLREFTPIRAEVDLTLLRARADEIYALRDRLEGVHGRPLYLPFQFRSNRAQLGMMSNYFAKMPSELVAMLFGPDGLASERLSPLPLPAAEAAPDGNDPHINVGTPPVGFLAPFKAKADTDYVVNVLGGRRTRSRKHEKLVNDFARWLATLGFEPGRNAAIDVGLEDPSVIVEGEVIGKSWAASVREAVGQLYEYRYFEVVDRDCGLVLLASEPVPSPWLEYVEGDRRIGCAWRSGANGFELSRLARRTLRQ